METWIIIGVVVVVVLLLCVALAIANFSFENFQEEHEKLDKIGNSRRLSTLEYVEEINKRYFSGRLKIVGANEYQDFYLAGKIGLSNRTMRSGSLASIAIVSHELGHARQDVSGNALTKRNRLLRQGRVCGIFFVPLLVATAVLCLLAFFNVIPSFCLYVGIGCGALAFLIFLFSIFLKFREVQIEHEATEFAVDFMREWFSEREVKQCKKLLDSAGLTYWASLLRTLLWWTGFSKKTTMFK